MYYLTDFSDARIFPLFLVMISWHITKGYEPEKFQCCKLSGSSVTEELQNHNVDVIMTSLPIFGILNFHIFCETTYKLSSCQVSNSSVI